MTWLFSDPLFELHETGQHPERPARLAAIRRHLAETGLDQQCEPGRWSGPPPAALSQVHSPEHIERVREVAEQGGGWLDPDTVLSPHSYGVATAAVTAAWSAVRQVVGADGPANALCLVRPPGHHARPDAAMGFCLFNQIAVVAQGALDELGLDRVLIVDWDVHHGNGTQESFWESDRVGFLSIHRWPFYPGSGAADEVGSGRGRGWTRNLPMEFGVTRREYLERFGAELARFADQVRPQLVLLSAGFDSHRADPIGSLGLEVEDFATLTELVAETARTHCGGKLVSLLEGGYNLDYLPLCVAEHLRGLLRSQG